jgi:hypothetical protein
MLKKFDYVLVPTPKMIPAFSDLKDASAIKVFPQGVDLSQFKVSDTLHSSQSKTVQFAYAGNFYAKIRNPEELFNHLSQVKDDFRFVLYTDMGEPENADLIEDFKKRLGDKLVIEPMLKRLDCIYALSKFDFLINVSNTTQTQTPSKLIDYKITARPIYSFTPGSFDVEAFDDFLSGNYDQDFSKELDLNDFDIRNIVRDIVALHEG